MGKNKLPLSFYIYIYIFLQSLGQDVLLRCNLDHLRDVQCRNSKSLGKAKFAVRFGIRFSRWAQGHVGSIKDPGTFNALDAGAVKRNLGNDNGALGIDLVFANWAAFFM